MTYKHKTPIHVRFADNDVFQHVNHAVYFSYLEEARHDYFKDVVGGDLITSPKGIIVAHAKVDYKDPILLEDKIKVYTRCSRIGTKSFDLEHSIVREEDSGEVEVASGMTVLVAYNHKKKKSIKIPKEWKKDIKAFEGI